MVRMGTSRLGSDDDIINKSLKRKFGHPFTKVEVHDLVKVFNRRGGRKDIDDSLKEYECNQSLSLVDPDYLESFTLETMRKKQDRKIVSFDDDDIDPQYSMFWSSLKSYGHLCVLEVSESNGLLAPIVYGADDGSDVLSNNESDELSNQKDEGNKLKDVVIELENEENDRACCALFTSPVSTHDLCSNVDVISVNSESSDSLHTVDIATNGQSRDALRTNKKEDSNNDSDYAWFLASNVFRQDGPDRNMLGCEANTYGRDDANSRQVGKRYVLRNRGYVAKTTMVKAGFVSRKNDEREVSFTRMRHKGSKALTQVRPNLEVDHVAKHALYERDNDMSYRYASRKNDEHEGHFTRLRHQGSKSCVAKHALYESDNDTCFVNSEQSDDARAEGDDTSLCIGKNPNVERNSGFRMELFQLLRKPYNASEHRKLFLDAKARKKMGRHFDFRNGRAASYSGKKHGKSYLDQHAGVKLKLSQAKDEFEELNLLRGFFFWLKNLTREDAFSPWRNKESLAVLPQPISKRKRQIENSESE